MTLSKDPVKRTIRDQWYWPLMAEWYWRNEGEQVVMLPGAHGWDAEAAEAFLKIPRGDMICVDKSAGVLASFTRHFKGPQVVTGDAFEVIEELGSVAPNGSVGLLDLDLCCCANPGVIDGLERLAKNTAICSGCVLGLTICQRWKTTYEQEKLILRALQPEVWVDQQYYTNSLKRSHMATYVFVL